MTLLLTVSCGKKEPEKEEENNGGQEVENLIYNSSSELYLIVGEGVDTTYIESIIEELSYYKSEKPLNNAPMDSALHTHEIVLGKTDREISVTAISRLNKCLITKLKNEAVKARRRQR